MFGIKILRKGDYDYLCYMKRKAEEERNLAVKKMKKAEADANNLRKQNSDLRQKVNSASMEDTSGLIDLVILKSKTCMCDKCSFSDSDDCQKLIFADRTVCVTHRKNINDFKTKKKK